MKMRQFKRTKLAMMSRALFGPWGPIGQWLTPATSRAVRGAPEGAMVIEDLSGQVDVATSLKFINETRDVLNKTAPLAPMATDTGLVEAFRQGMAEQAAKYVVQRVKDNEIVGEFDTREEALALMLKHARQKKAKLHVFQNGDPVLFSDDEVLNNAVSA